jgi:hypothetical protein
MIEGKPTNPKDALGIRKWRTVACIPLNVLWEVGLGMFEGARKYGRHNYRIAGVRSSVYVEAAMGHIMQWWEGEDTDPDTRLSHVTKAICSLVVLRDAEMRGMLNDDRPPPCDVGEIRDRLQGIMDEMIERMPEPLPAYTHEDKPEG